MHFFPVELISNLIGLAAVAVGALIARRIKTPTDSDRAATLARIAEGAAALIVSLNPGKNWADLLALTVQQIVAAAGIPTRNAAAIERAAAAALSKLGKLPLK